MRFSTSLLTVLCLSSSALLGACDDDEHNHNENEVITTVILTFTPAAGGAAVTATFNDPDGDGGAAPTVDPINLVAATTYTAAVRFENRLETPAEDITVEVADEATEHQVFFTGTAVNGPASNQTGAALTHSYADTDAGGLPIGLANSFVAARGTGTMLVTLRHMPPVNSAPAKTASAAMTVKDAGGFSTLGGATDVSVTFQVTVP
ncbi:MAG: hypothetical protein IPI49_03530 [Myxococcales bacterium]|nr:hypothetical protein [Myxococcales bacterium]